MAGKIGEVGLIDFVECLHHQAAENRLFLIAMRNDRAARR